MSKKTAVICFNLGGPDNLDAIQPFLFNLFNDKAIIRLPWPFRTMLAKLISSKRAPIAKEIYGHIGNKSPILELTTKQTEVLEKALNMDIKSESSTEANTKTEYKTFIAMRYWKPLANEAVKKVKEWGADNVILLPLYPQFSTTTSGSSIQQCKSEMKKAGLNIGVTTIGCYPTEDSFIAAHAELIKESIKKVGDKPFRLLFSAHGLPEKIVDAGDSYQWQVEQTTKAVMEKLTEDLGQAPDHIICYQSRVGPLKWIGPSTEDEISNAGKDEKAIILIPIAFVSEHSETLVELDIEYKELADEHGVKDYIRVPALGTTEHFINALRDVVLLAQQNNGVISHKNQRLCPKSFGDCICH